MNMKQGVAKKGACMLFPQINSGEMASVPGMKNLKWFANPVRLPYSVARQRDVNGIWTDVRGDQRR